MIFSIAHSQTGNMEDKNQLTQEELQLLKSANALSANSWLKLKGDAARLSSRMPDPAFVLSQDWPDFEESELETTVSETTQLPAQTTSSNLEQEESKSPDEKIDFLKIPETQISHVVAAETQESSSMKAKKTEKIKKNKSFAETGTVETPSSKAEKKPKSRKKRDSEEPGKGLDFYHWLDALGKEHGSKKSQKTEKAEVKARSSAVLSAENSLRLGAAIVSETLAKLLVRQGHKEDAIAMYEKLIQKYPQKETTFAAAIEKLKS